MDEEKRSILIPILTHKERDLGFIEQIADSRIVGKIVLLFVVDQEKMKDVPAAFVGSRIKASESVIDEIVKALPKSIDVKDYVEWGYWPDKVENLYKLEKIDEIFMIESDEARNLQSLLEGKNLEIRTFTP